MKDPRELKDRAAQHFAKGRFAKASADYAELCRFSPDDGQLRVRHGEALRRDGDEPGAIAAWELAADTFARQGLLPRAIAALKLILELDAGHVATQRRLAALYARRTSLPAPAAAQARGPAPRPSWRRPAATRPAASASGLELDDAPKPFAHGMKVEPSEALEGDSGLELDTDGGGDWKGAQSWTDDASPGEAGAHAGETGAERAAAEAPETLIELQISEVDEDEEIEILTELADRPAEADALPRIPLFSDLSREAFVALASRCILRGFPAGEVILRQGSAGGSFWVLVSGTVEVRRAAEGGTVALAQLTEGDFFGEMALLSGAPRSASVVALTDVEALEISAMVLADLMRSFPHVGQVLKRFCRERLLRNVLSTSPLFNPFPPAERDRLIARFQPLPVAGGSVVIEEGRPSDGLYVVMSGRLEVLRRTGGSPQPLALLKEGDVFGEISLLLKQAATATVAASGPATLLRLPRESFDELISTHPQVLELVSDLCEHRLREQHIHLGPPDGVAVRWV